MQIGKKPRYVTSQPSTFMKGIEVELEEKRIKDAKDSAERSVIVEETDDDNNTKTE